MAMFPMLMIAVLAARIITASDETAAVTQRESDLENAVRSKNKTVLTALTDQNFHIDWSQGTAIQEFQAKMTREEWIDCIAHLRMESYDIEISKVTQDGRWATRVILKEYWTLLSPHGRRIEKRIDSFDLWIKSDDGWKLASRICRSVQ